VTAEEKAPLRLKKVTLTYSHLEDRIRMDAEEVPGNVVTFWLTQRLCKELVKSLVVYFNKSDMALTGSSPRSLATVQGFLHQSAKINKKQADAVAPQPSKIVLLDKVQLRTSKNVVQMSLSLPGGESAVLALSLEEARQWMDILYQQYLRAEWPLQVWPDWVTAKPGHAEREAAGADHLH